MGTRTIQPSEIEEVRCLLKVNGWERGVASAEEFRQLLSRSHHVLVAVEHGEIMAFLRAFGDGIADGYISTLVVAEAHRRKGSDGTSRWEDILANFNTVLVFL